MTIKELVDLGEGIEDALLLGRSRLGGGLDIEQRRPVWSGCHRVSDFGMTSTRLLGAQTLALLGSNPFERLG